MKNTFRMLVAGGALLASSLASAGIGLDRFAYPFVGSSGVGHVTPAAAYPFGLVQAGPDTSADGVYQGGWAHTSGYQHGERFVHRFSQLHLSGTGCASLGKIGILPFSVSPAEGADYRAEIVPESEVARPGRYSVRFADGIAVEIAAAPHAAAYRIAFPEGAAAKLLVDLDWAAASRSEKPASVFGSRTFASSLTVDAPDAVSGSLRTADWVEYELHFAMAFSSDCRVTCLKPQQGLRGGKWIVDFGKAGARPLEIRLALSLGSVEAARRNLAAEIPGFGFDAVRAKAERAWSDWFSRVEIDAAAEPAAVTNFASALYRLALQPNDIGDAGKSEYSTFSLWDTFRAAHPLYTILCPEKANAFVNSLLDHGERLGTLPLWPLMGRETHCMIGHHAVPVIADAILKGLANPGGTLGKGIDRERAFRLVDESLRREHRPTSTATWGLLKEDWEALDRYGYYPFDRLTGEFEGKKVLGESVSRTLECAYDDACAARLALALGKREEAAFFARRAGNWTNVFDRASGFARGRDSAGRWREPFDPFDCGAGPWIANDFTEGNSWQYTWHVMHDPEGLVAAMGGKEKFGEKLAALFAQRETVRGSSFVHDVSGLVGQYAHGNEPSHHVAYFFRWSDRPWMTDEIVRRVFDTQYFARADGLCGNDDCGQMAAWYVFSALGFYPFDPCGGEYVLGAPQVPGAVVRLEGGRTLKVVAKNFSRENRYVKSVAWNGRPLAGWILRHEELARGGELVFEMAPNPSER